MFGDITPDQKTIGRKNPKGYNLTVQRDGYRNVFQWRREGEDKISAIARFLIDEEDVRSVLESQIAEVAEDLYSDSDLDDDTFYERIESDIRDATSNLYYETPIYLSEVRVLSEEDRGQHLGSDLMQELESELTKNGFDAIYLQAAPSERALWYRRLGFDLLYPREESDMMKVFPVLKKDI